MLKSVFNNFQINQAETMKLQQHATDRRSEVEDAYRKLDMGLPPTEDAEMEWQRMLRDDEMKSARILQKQQVLILAILHRFVFEEFT